MKFDRFKVGPNPSSNDSMVPKCEGTSEFNFLQTALRQCSAHAQARVSSTAFQRRTMEPPTCSAYNSNRSEIADKPRTQANN